MHGGDIYSEKIKYDFSISVNPLGFPSWAKVPLKIQLKRSLPILMPPAALCSTGFRLLQALRRKIFFWETALQS